jgi:hypothetical protein
MSTHRASRLGLAVAGALLLAACGSALVEAPHRRLPRLRSIRRPWASADPQSSLKALAARPTPHLSDGRPDLNATWDHLGGIEFIRVQKGPAAEGSVCVFGCEPAGLVRPPRGRPQVRRRRPTSPGFRNTSPSSWRG